MQPYHAMPCHMPYSAMSEKKAKQQKNQCQKKTQKNEVANRVKILYQNFVSNSIRGEKKHK
jgi:hypothetical protein